MRSGELLADRFEILDRAGAGGMGAVYRARDRSSGEIVALKVLHRDQRPDRFLREAAVLAELSHPAVVRYVAHGVSERGEVYLAMEWLEATSLSTLIAGRRLSYAECVTLLRRVCAGLAVAHQLGVVHRDLKPANILVPDGVLAQAKLIDFGIARRRFDPRITERGLLIGTLAYMSPEQARGATQIEPASDVFALGSVVYKCLTGETPFGGGDSTSVLAKVLLDDPTPLSVLVSGVPPEFDALVARMLAKAPENRPRDAGAVLTAVEDLPAAAGEAPAAPGITGREQRVVWIALMAGPLDDDVETSAATETQRAATPDARLGARIAAGGGRFDILADGTRVASFVGSGTPRDQALGAVHAAEAMREMFPDRPVAVGSGLGEMGGRAPVGTAIDEGVRLLGRTRPGRVGVDDATARLVAGVWELEARPDGGYSLGERRGGEPTRRLLGRVTTFVGRDRELATLEALLDECVEEPVARVALVVAPAGHGKSRLRYELLRRTRERYPSVEIFLGRGDSVSRGSPFSLLRGALRASAGVRDGEPVEVSRGKIATRVRQSARPGSPVDRTTAFLGELADVSFPDEAHPSLAAVRRNPTLLGDAMRGAWLDFLADECAAHPVVLVLEDLHWGDLPTTTLVDAALGSLADAPLFVLALARPEVHDVLPNLWRRREPQEVRLGPLRRQAALALAREVLGAGADEPSLERAVELADGNAFFLEELLRALAEGRSDLPETVLGMLHARLEALGPESRRILRAASVFGGHFWPGGVHALLGAGAERSFVAAQLDQLENRELLARRPSTSLEGEPEYVFRHSTLREAVYATLTPQDRTLGHRLAGEWLERVGASDTLALAEHFRLGEAPRRAARFYLDAAEQALEGADLEAVLGCVQRALELDPDDAVRGALHHLTADAKFWRGEYEDALSHARAALDLLPPGSARWYVAVGALSSSAGALGKDQELIAWGARAAAQVPEDEEARATQVVALVRASHGHLKLGLYQSADALIAAAEQQTAGLGKLATLGRAWVHHGKSARAYYAGDVGSFIAEIEAAIRDFDAIGDWRTGGNARANLGYAVLSIGDFERAEQLLTEALALTERLGLAGIGHYVMHNLGLALAYRGRLDAALEMERRAIFEAEARKESLLVAGSHLYLALILLRAGDHAEAEREAAVAEAAAATVPTLRAQALAAQSAALLAQGKLEPALDRARGAMALLEQHGGSDETEGRVRAAYVEALSAVGRDAEARAAARVAAGRLRERAASLGDSRLERCFLENVPEHARLLELAGPSVG